MNSLFQRGTNFSGALLVLIRHLRTVKGDSFLFLLGVGATAGATTRPTAGGAAGATGVRGTASAETGAESRKVSSVRGVARGAVLA